MREIHKHGDGRAYSSKWSYHVLGFCDQIWQGEGGEVSSQK